MTTRRTFLGQCGVGALGTLHASYAYSAAETVNIGIIGAGGRAQALMRSLLPIPGCRIIAVCDVWDENLEKGQKLVGEKCFRTKDHRALLDRKDIDAVLIGTPDHLHVPLTVDACDAGKDVYVEKPLTHDLSEGEKVVKARDRSGRVVQVGMQQRSMPQIREGRAILKSGQLGEVHKVHLTWNRNLKRVHREPKVDPDTVDWKRFLGPAREQPFDAYRFRNWRWFWDFGGGILTDLMVHFIDVAHWFLDLDHPATATTIGDHFQAAGSWETPDTTQTLLRYPDRGVQVYFEGTFSSARNAAMIEFMGTDATLYLDRGRYEVIPELRRDADGKPVPPSFRSKEWILGTGPRGADFYDIPDGERLHLENWLECIRSRQQPNAPVEAGVSAAAAAHLGNRALRSGQVAHWGESPS
jgi:predicted dehydrogenase